MLLNPPNFLSAAITKSQLTHMEVPSETSARDATANNWCVTIIVQNN